ncbi:arsenite methyltransferase [Saccharibacillus alkalitolerans]|uniref:Arsenite methyltransferase n=1 Tax=Saccharibacillus alkalitolerans TaxID=2705290 RepID=A0ABX0F790_9BACL|nr:arsenite methyltransferase [Saccharibacillus alkalitolerans]NGZ75056.1 arsenite methyltransferase [Saccharibacillus alkalitolerans]
MNSIDKDQIRQNVRSHYRGIAAVPSSCCSASSLPDRDANAASALMGYSDAELQAAPEGANLGLGCGNPQAIASLRPGETVLDLGSGGGFDCFLAARQVGAAGQVIGVDMTPEMISRARSNAEKAKASNIEFRLGEIEHLPVADNGIDVIISNCVINLSPDKQQVFDEAFRVLRSGGRLAISDIVTTAELPPAIKNDLHELYSGCISGASSAAELTTMLERSGFADISIEPKEESRSFIRDWVPGAQIDDYIRSAVIRAVKP